MKSPIIRASTRHFKIYDGMMRPCATKARRHIMLKVYNKQVNWPKPEEPRRRALFRYMTARYQAYPTWLDFSKEAYNERDNLAPSESARTGSWRGRLPPAGDCA